MNLDLLERILFGATAIAYIGSFSLQVFAAVRTKPGGASVAGWLLLGGWLAQTGAGVARWIASGHAPVTDTYELNLTGTWVTVGLVLLFQRLGKVDRAVALVVTPIVFLTLGYGYVARTEVAPLGPAYQSPWLWVHVIFAWLAFGSYAISTGAAVLLILKERRPQWRIVARARDPEALDLMSYRFVILGFIHHAVMLASGSIWAKKLWGRYWSWDALETWSLIAFLFYALYLHSRSFLKWRMQRAAWLSIVGLVILAVSFWGVGLFAPSAHPGP